MIELSEKKKALEAERLDLQVKIDACRLEKSMPSCPECTRVRREFRCKCPHWNRVRQIGRELEEIDNKISEYLRS